MEWNERMDTIYCEYNNSLRFQYRRRRRRRRRRRLSFTIKQTIRYITRNGIALHFRFFYGFIVECIPGITRTTYCRGIMPASTRIAVMVTHRIQIIDITLALVSVYK